MMLKTMCKWVSVMAVLGIAVPAMAGEAVFEQTYVAAQAAEFERETVHGVTWYYEVRAGRACIVAPGAAEAGETDGFRGPAWSSAVSGKRIPAVLCVPAVLGDAPVKELHARALSQLKGLRRVVLPEGLETIGERAFVSCHDLEAVELPESVVSVGRYAFGDCPKLPTDKGLQFEGPARRILVGVSDTSLSGITVPGSVRFLHTRAFADCEQLTSVALPDTLVGIGEDLFNDSPRLPVVNGIRYESNARKLVVGCGKPEAENLILPPSVRYYTPEALLTPGIAKHRRAHHPRHFKADTYGRLYSADGTRLISAYGASDAATENTPADGGLPEGLREIAPGAFRGDAALTELKVPESVTYIGAEAFAGCPNLTSVYLPDSVTVLGSGAFSGCEQLKQVRLPKYLRVIKSNTFSHCFALEPLILPDSLRVIGERAFFRCERLILPAKLPKQLEAVGSGAFSGCLSLRRAVFPETLRLIGSRAFENCTALTSADIQGSDAAIDELAFLCCSRLRAVTLGEGVKSIGSNAFAETSPHLRFTLCCAPGISVDTEAFGRASGRLALIPAEKAPLWKTRRIWHGLPLYAEPRK